jgi:hypothetical protein
VAKFVLASSHELRAEIDRIDYRYKDAPQELHEAAVTVITTLESLIPAAEQRESAERQQHEQEAERERQEAERKAEEERKALAEAEARIEAERKQRAKEAEAEQKRMAEEAECRRAEDMGQTVADIADLLIDLPEEGQHIKIAEMVADAIVNGEISHTFWNNEK